MGIRSSRPESRRSVAYLPENPAFYDFLTAEEYLRFVSESFGIERNVVHEKIESSLKLLELWDDRARPIRGFSKGMVQRLGLAQALIHDPAVYILDEPTTGLHFDDVSKLLTALRKLIDGGGSLVVIEHNLDVIKSADWVIDLGPEGGGGGGEVVAAGTPEEIAAHPASHTGRWLRNVLAG